MAEILVLFLGLPGVEDEAGDYGFALLGGFDEGCVVEEPEVSSEHEESQLELPPIHFE